MNVFLISIRNKKSFFMTIGQRLLEIRESMGKTQEEFAAIGGTTRQTQRLYEKDKTMPNAAYLAAIAAIGADITYIITGQHAVFETPEGYKGAVLSPRERALIENVRALEEEDKRAVERLALRAAEAKQTEVIEERKNDPRELKTRG